MKYLKTVIFEFTILISLTLIETILYYFNIVNNSVHDILKIIIFIITFLFTGIYLGKLSNKKYYLEGIKISLGNIILFILFSIIFKYEFNIKQILYYLMLIALTTTSSIFGGNIKKNKN